MKRCAAKVVDRKLEKVTVGGARASASLDALAAIWVRLLSMSRKICETAS